MEPKKSEKSNVENWSGVFRDVGLVIALAGVLMAFTYRKTTIIENSLFSNMDLPEEEDMADITREEKKPPPPPPPPEIEVVDDEEIIEDEQPDFEEPDIEDDFEVELEEPEVEEVAAEPIHVSVEKMPEFPEGGEKGLVDFLRKNVNYPPLERQNDIEGVSYIKFVVDNDGSIYDVKVYPGAESKGTANMHKEAMRVIKSMPKWKPGKQNGKPVKVHFQIPVRFTLN